MTSETDRFSVAGGMWTMTQQTSIGQKVVPGRPTCGNNRKDTVGDSWLTARAPPHVG